MPSPAAGLRRINQMYTMFTPRYRVFGQWFVCHLPWELWPEPGDNEFELTLLERDPVMVQEIALRDVELEIRYLMGRNYHRIPEHDLGPRIPSGI